MTERLEETAERFVIDNDEKAEWALARIREATEEHERVIALYNAEKERLEAYKAQADQRLETATGYIKGLLAAYLETVPTKKTKTTEKYQLLTGRLVKKLGGIDYKRDDAQLVGWLKDNGKAEYIKVTEAPAWGELKKGLDVVDGNVIDRETGILVDGVTAERKPDTFTIEFAEV